jgi:DNA repair protein RadC
MGKIVEPYFERNGPGRLQSILHFRDFQETATYLQQYLNDHQHEKYIIVCKGSQNTIFLEEVVKSLLVHPRDTEKLTRQ